MNGIMLHCGANSINRNTLGMLPVPSPMGPKHAIRPFIDDVEIVADAMAANDMVIKNEAYGVTMKGDMPARFFGLMEVERENADFGLMVGLRGSYDQTLPRGLAVGSNVFVCDNLCFSGDITLHTKQTTHVGTRIPQMLRDAVARIPGMAEAQDEKFDGYKHHRVAKRIGDAMLVEMVRRGVLNPSQLGKALAEWDKPSHDEHANWGDSLWQLHNAVTEALKPANPEANAVQRNWKRTTDMTGFLDEVRNDGFPIYQNAA